MSRIILLCAVLVGGCTDDDVQPELDPTGNWNVTYAFAASCGNPATTTTGTFTVTLDAQGYDIIVVGVSSTGSMLCTSEQCKLSGTFAWMTGDATYQQSMNLVLDAEMKVGGNGTETVITTESTCTYPFTVTGSKT